MIQPSTPSTNNQSHSSNPPGALLALDLGQHTGWALAYPRGAITSGTEVFKAGRFEGGGMPLLRFAAWLGELHVKAGPLTRVVFEEVRAHKGTAAAHTYGAFLGQMTAWCELHQVPYQGVPVATIKKHATGKGNAGKEEMIAAARSRGHQPGDDNEADALAILHWALPGGASCLR